MVDEPFIVPSAHRHGVGEDAIIRASDHSIRVEEVDEGLTMLVGPDPAGNLYETGVVDSHGGPVIVHTRPARAKFIVLESGSELHLGSRMSSILRGTPIAQVHLSDQIADAGRPAAGA